MKNFRVDIMSVLMREFLKNLGAKLNKTTTEDNFIKMRALASDFDNKEILAFLKDIEERDLKEMFFKPQKEEI